MNNLEWNQLTSELLPSFRREIEAVDWPHSFVREVSLLSPSYVTPDDQATVAPDFLPCARIFVSSADSSLPGMELFFLDVEEISFWFGGDLEPTVSMQSSSFSKSENKIEWRFSKSHNSMIRSSRLFYRFLDTKSWGHKMRYGWEEIFDSGGTFVGLPE